MPIDFKYVPPSPEPISGPSFIHQTEQAIIELGGLADDAQNTANQALSSAQNAQNTANTALSTAQGAQSTADSAQNTADGAQALAETAQNIAVIAQNAANTAYDLAAIADSKADNAQTTANQGLTVANTALADALNAQQTADTAQQNAEDAGKVADYALGRYKTINTDDPDLEPQDADEFYVAPFRLYFSGTTEVANLPDGVELPVFFDVRIDDNNNTAWQTVTLEGGAQVWTRMAEVTKPQNDEGGEGEHSVVWTAWVQSGGSSENAQIAEVGKPGLVAPDGETTIVNPLTGAMTVVTSAAESAAKLTIARTFRTNLASTATALFDGTANVTPGVTGTLPIGNGGTGNTTGLAASATKLATARTVQTNLASTATASFDGTANVTPGVTGTLPITNGGTGATTAAAALAALGITYGTADLTAGTSALATGSVYFVYE